MTWKLAPSNRFSKPAGPVVVVVLDGIGLAPPDRGNAVHLAHTPTLDWLASLCPFARLRAHGTAVGLPSDKDMGNSEVGHNALGAGRVFDQGAKLVNVAIEDGSIFEGKAWKQIIERCRAGGAFHLIGLLSDGNVHSHIDQLFALIRKARASEVKRLFVHPLLDGRDVPETSALEYIGQLEAVLGSIHGSEGRVFRIASGGGRMLVTMDRYQADWRVVERGYNAHVLGKGRPFASATEAIEIYRAEDHEIIDQFLPEFVVTDQNGPVGPIRDGDSVVFFNFRGDRAIEISMAFEQDDFHHFKRERKPDVLFAGMMLYDGDLQIPHNYLVPPPEISRTMGEYLARNGYRQLAAAETQKYGHVTYFWNGNKSGKFADDLEEYVEVPSDRVPFEQRPWMKAAEVTDAFIRSLRSNKTDFARINYANGDMVGHTGNLEAARLAVESVDLCLGRLIKAIRDLSGTTLVTADHGNADEMFEKNKKTGEFLLDEKGRPRPKTSHTLSPVPLYLVRPAGSDPIDFRTDIPQPGLSNICATSLCLMGIEPPDHFDPSLI